MPSFPSMFTDLKYRLRAIFRRSAMEKELAAELQFHCERMAAKLVAAGVPPDEALRRARLSIGGVEQVKEECREARGTAAFESTLQDVQYGLRQLRRRPGFALVVVASLALGIGANTAIFSLIDAVLLRMLPIDDPAGLHVLVPRQTNGNSRGFEYPEYRRLSALDSALAGVAAVGSTRLNVSIDGGMEPTAEGQLVSGSYFQLLGVRAIAGRAIEPADDVKPNGHPVAVISHGYWNRRFGREPSVVGRTIHLSGAPFTIVGVAPREFFGLEVGRAPDIWVPLTMQPTVMPAAENWLGEHLSRTFWLTLVGRVKPDYTLQQADVDAGGTGRARPADDQTGQARRAAPGHSRTAEPQPRRNRHFEPAPTIFAAAPHPDGGRLGRPPDCLRECRQPRARPLGGAAAGVLDAPGTRRWPMAARPPVAGRERHPRDARRARRLPAGALGDGGCS